MRRTSWLAGCSLLSLLTVVPAVAETSSLDAAALVKKSVALTERDWQAAPKYRFRERDVKGKGTETYEVYLLDGSQYNKLVARNDRPLTAAEQQAEDAKLAREVERRRNESPVQRAKRVAKYQHERDDDHLMLREMANAFTYRITGEDTINGRGVYVLEAAPKPTYKPANARAKVLTQMRGKLWIDKAETQWVRVEAEVMAPVSMYLLAKVSPGTKFVLEQMRIAPNLWLPKHFQMKAKATVLGFSHNEMDDETYSDYRANPVPASVVAETKRVEP